MTALLKSAEPRRKLSYVQRVSPLYHYFCYPGAKRERLPGLEGSAEYIARYNALLAAAEQRKKEPIAASDPVKARVAFLPGSVGWVATQFLAHPDFTQGRKAGTQTSYRVMIDILRRSESGIAKGPIAGLKPDHVNHHCNEIEKEHGHSRGDYQALIISVLWKFARKRLSKQCKLGGLVNPVRERERTYRAKPRKAWPLAVQRAFYEGAPEHLQLAFALLLYTGQRRGDVCNMRWRDIEDGKGGEEWLAVEQEKTGVTVPVLLHGVLRRALMKHARAGSEFILTTPTGKRYDKGRLTKAIQKRLVEIGQPKSKYTLHGLRKAAAVLLAEGGATVEQLMSVMGWRTAGQAIYYCREANKKTLNRAAWAFLDKEAA